MQRKIFPQLDGLRGLAALIVVAHHFWDGSVRWDPTHGRIGVDLFFLLSGFLITRNLILSKASPTNTRGAILRRFHVRRIIRIIPLFYMTLTFAWLLHWEKPSAGLWWHYAFLSNVLFIRLGRITEAGGHLWALAVEQQFYLFWPFIVLWVPGRHLMKASIAMVVLGTFTRFFGGLAGWTPMTIDFMTPGSFETLGMGALLACWMREREETPERTSRWITSIGLAGLLLAGLPWTMPSENSRHWIMLFSTELSRAFLLTWIIGQAVWGFPGWIGEALQSTPARALGNWSYGIYLSHNFFMGGFKVAGKPWGGLSLHLTQVIGASLATLLWSIACYAYFEKPLLDWSKDGAMKARDNKVLYSPVPTSSPSDDVPLAS
jgi:peptidoglycan/LPS O-acetylase OafA/YrhL